MSLADDNQADALDTTAVRLAAEKVQVPHMLEHTTEDTSDSTQGPAQPSSPAVAAAAPVEDFGGVKPPWSVLSLRRLLEAVQETARTAPLREAERFARRLQQADEERARQTAADAQAWKDRYRNAWENA